MSEIVSIPLGRTTAYLVRETRPILIDCGTPGNEVRIVNRMRGIRIDPRDLALIVVTHVHSDHVGSLPAMKALSEAPVAVHALEAGALQTGRNAALVPNSLLARVATPFLKLQKPLPGVKPELVIDGVFDLREYGVAGEILPTPGHTLGSLSVVLEGGEAIVGDLVMGGLFRPRVPHVPMIASDVDQVRASVKALLDRGVTRFYAAHGGPFAPEALRALLDAHSRCSS